MSLVRNPHHITFSNKFLSLISTSDDIYPFTNTHDEKHYAKNLCFQLKFLLQLPVKYRTRKK